MQPQTDPPISHQGLLRVLGEAQRIGALGSSPLFEIIRHASWFADAIPIEAREIVDLGSGAGVPGLIVAVARPELRVILVDRRQKRVDALVRAIALLGKGGQVAAVCADVDKIRTQESWQGRFDAAISRGFGPPLQTLAWSVQLVRPGGVVVISEPPDEIGDRWAGVDLVALGVAGPIRVGPLAMFHVEHQDI